MGLSFTAIQLIPLSTFEVLFNSKGVVGTLLSHFMLGERMNWLNKLVSAAAFVGLVLVIKPGLLLSWFLPSFQFHDENQYGRQVTQSTTSWAASLKSSWFS